MQPGDDLLAFLVDVLLEHFQDLDGQGMECLTCKQFFPLEQDGSVHADKLFDHINNHTN